ncbi:hypothetical protein [Bacteroides pyogenes]|uniref:DUF4784 family protein n=1 Tax=Bacteroides pyogenes TaxID=310300 RepID=UPI003C6BDAED
MRYYSLYYCKMRYFYFFLMIMCVLFVFIGCDDENEKELPFVTNVSIADADKIFRPGDAVVVKAEGFLESDDIRLNIKWILSEEEVCRNARCTSFFVHRYTNRFIIFKLRYFEDFFDLCVSST